MAEDGAAVSVPEGSAVTTRSRLRRLIASRFALVWPLAMLLVLAVSPGVAHAQLPYSRSGMLTGIDVSHWQGYIRWSAVADAGVKFAIAKATDGRSFTDPRYSRNYSRATAAGIPFGAYHFARPDGTYRDAVREADFFVDTANLAGSNLLPALDLEVTGGLGRTALTAWVKNWLVRVEMRLGVKPMIYTNPVFWRDHLGNTTWFAANGYRVLWIAHWGADSPNVPATDWNGHSWTFWQVTSGGKVPGIDGYVDIDLFDGLELSRALIKNNR